MGVETELFGIKNRPEGQEFKVIERADGSIAVLAGDKVLVDSGVTPVTAVGAAQVSKCIAGGADQSSRFVDEVLSAAAAGVPLILPAGVINLSGISSTINVAGLRLVSLYGLSWLDAGSAKYVDLFNVTAGDVELQRIGFRKFKRPVMASATLGSFVMRQCALQQNRSGVTLWDRSDNPNSYSESIVIDGCRVIDSPGFELKSAFGSALITRNYVLRGRRDTGLWDSAGAGIYGICIGDHDDVPPAYAQDISCKVIVSDNIIAGVTNDTASPMITAGISVAATDVVVANNVISDVSCTSGVDGYGLYLKSKYGQVVGNVLTDAGSGLASLAVKGKSYGSPLAKNLHVHHNTMRATKDIPVGLIVFGSSIDVTVESNVIDGFYDGAVRVFGNPVRTKVINNDATNCGGLPYLWACGDITDCEHSGNSIGAQRVPVSTDRTRPYFPYGTSGAYQMQGHAVRAMKGALNVFNVTNGGSGYTVDGLPNGSFQVALSGGAGGTGGSAYATIANGVLVSVVPMDQGVGWTTAPSVAIPLASTGGVVVACSGSQASVTTVLSTGKLSGFVASRNKVRGSMGYSASNPDANAYEALFVSVDDLTSGPLIVDGVDVVDNGAWAGANPYYIVGLSLSGQPIQVGRATGIRLLGSSSGRRMQPWRALGGATLHRQGSFGARFHLGPADIDGGVVHPQSTISTIGSRTRLFINFARFTSAGSTYIGTIVGGQSSGAARITRVTPRFVGPALSAASGTPTVGVGTASNTTNLVPATAIASIASVTSPVDGTPANDVVAGSTDVDLYLTIAGGAIAASASSVLCVDIDWTITA